MIMGYPAIGKSKIAQKYIDQGYTRLNRDKLGGKLDDLIPKMQDLYDKGIHKFVLDNTYMTKEARAPVIKWAKNNNFSIKCVWITSKVPDAIEVAQYNAVKRMLDKYGKVLTHHEIKKQREPNFFPPAALFAFRKKFQKPKKQEGFDTIEIIKFQREINKNIYKNKAIILDYDGTLRTTKSGEKYPKDPEDIEILPNREEILKHYVEKGYKLLGLSNQSFISKGTISHQQAEACFDKTNELLGVDIDYKFCPHSAFPLNCYCRKPMPGLGVEFIEKYKLDPDKTIMVGDQTTDKTFARRCGIKFIHSEEFFEQIPDLSKLEDGSGHKNKNAEKKIIEPEEREKKSSKKSKTKNSIQTILIDLPHKSDKFKGLSFCFSGPLESMNVADAEKLVLSHQGTVKKPNQKVIDYLVISNNTELSNSNLTKNKNIKILTEKEFLKMVKTRQSIIKDFKNSLESETDENFELFNLKEEMPIKKFIEKQGLTFKSGSAYYELMKKEQVHPTKKIIVLNKNTGETYFDADARQFLSITTTKKVYISPTENTEKNYKIFIQSKSYNRKLPKDSTLLYIR